MHRILWLHEDALRSHKVQVDRVVYLWDDNYLQSQHYSFKRLVFIYETLCEMPEVEILRGDTLEMILQLAPTTLMIPATANPFIRSVVAILPPSIAVEWLEEIPFASIKKPRDTHRFFQYWKQAEKTAFLENGGHSHA